MKRFIFIAYFRCVGLIGVYLTSCSNNDIHELWRINESNNAFEFQKEGRGIYYENLSNQRGMECFSYTYDSIANKLAIKCHKDSYKLDWNTPIDETWHGTVKVISDNRVLLTINGGTLTLTRE